MLIWMKLDEMLTDKRGKKYFNLVDYLSSVMIK